MTDRTPAHLTPYVDVLGEDMAIDFFLTYGGAPLYLAGRPQDATGLTRMIGRDKIAALSEALDASLVRRVPIDRKWIARRLKAKGASVLSIARSLHVTDVTVRKMLKDKDERQLSFFDRP